LTDPRNWWRLKRIIEENGYDIVVGNSPHAVDFIRFTFPLLRKKPKLVFVRRTDRVPSFFSKWFKYRIADRIVVISKKFYEKLLYEKFFPNKLIYIPSGLDLSLFNPATPSEKEYYRKKLGLPLDSYIFINVANWNPKVKGQTILLDAFEIFLKRTKCQNCLLLLAGYETDSYKAKREIIKRNLTSKVIGLGFRKDIPLILKAADVGISASFIEGLGNAILQYMATKLLVISTKTLGVSSYLKHLENGFLVPVGDKYQLAIIMEKVMKLRKEERDRIVENAFRTASEFSIENTAKKYAELFKELAG